MLFALLHLVGGASAVSAASAVNVEVSPLPAAAPFAGAMSVSVNWAPLPIRGRLSLIVSRDLTAEPRLSMGSSFANAGQIFSVEVDCLAGEGSFPAPGQASFPFGALEDFPPGTVTVQAVLTPYTLYNRSDGHSLWLPGFRSLTYSEDYDSYGWANVTAPFGGAKGLSAEGALFSKPARHTLPFDGVVELTLSETVPAFPEPPPETSLQKYVSMRSPALSHFWGQEVNVSAWVTLPAGFDAHPDARFPLIINHGHYSYQRLRGWADEPPPRGGVAPVSKTGNPDDCYYCSSGGGCCHDCAFTDSFQQEYE